MRKQPKYLGLKRPKVRQSWNIHNLYNLARGVGVESNLSSNKTFFQQKWAAKSRTRGYHGDHISEKKWKRMFTRRPSIAVDMPAKYLAKHDGSEQAAGRGSGLSTGQPSAKTYAIPTKPAKTFTNTVHPAAGRARTPDLKLVETPISEITPTMQMTFAPLERRLDTAIFRALFSTSVRQARQFVVHGAVKVNGKKVIHPAYQLNPGDMFQVQAEKVMHATGAHKSGHTMSDVRRVLTTNETKFKHLKPLMLQARFGWLVARAWEKDNKKDAAAAPETAAEDASETAAEGASETVSETAADAPTEQWPESDAEARLKQILPSTKVDDLALRKMRLELALIEAKYVVRDKKQDRPQTWLALKLRSFRDRACRALSISNPKEVDDEKLLTLLQAEMTELGMIRGAPEANVTAEVLQQRRKKWMKTALWVDSVPRSEIDEELKIVGTDSLSPKEMTQLSHLLRRDLDNPVDETKPYPTPWVPRPYMKPFTFIPRYLEVNHSICAAIYMRHPVVRKGSAEVPTPFGFVTNQLAHNWYVERS